jgi:PAS domain S-box-containing protein
LESIEINHENLFQKMPEGVVYEDALGLPILMNPAAEKMLGYTLAQLRGEEPFDEGFHVIHLDGSVYEITSHATIVSLRTGQPVNNEIMGIYSVEENKYKWISMNSTPEFREGEKNPYRVFATIRDITEQIEAERKLKAQSELMELLVFTSTSFINISEDKLHETINLSLKKLGEFVKADRMYVFDYDWGKQICSNTYEWCGDGIEPQIDFLRDVPLEGLEDWTESHTKGESVYVENVFELSENATLRQILEPQGVISLLAMPIMDGTRCTGFIGLDSVKTPHTYNENEINLLKIFTGILSNVKNRLESERQLKERIKELNSIYRISNLTIQSDIPEDNLLAKIVEIIPEGFFEPQITSARITFQGNVFESVGFKNSSNFIQEKIHLNSIEVGSITVFLPEGNHFLVEERRLVPGICNIISKHFESKINLRESQNNERQLKNLLNTQTSYVLRTDLMGRHTYWNEKFKEEFGWIYGEDGLDGGNALQSICEYHHARTLDTVQNCIKFPGKIFPIELDKPGKGEEIITTLWEFVALVNDQGNPSEIQCMGVNITDRKKAENRLIESENRLRSLLESQTNYVIRTDLDGIYTFWNTKYEEDFGYKYPNQGLEEVNSLDSLCEYDKEKAREIANKCIESPSTVFQVELDKENKSGKIVTTFWDFVCLIDSEGRPFEIQCVGIDISDRKEAEKNLKESEEKYRFLFEESPDGYLLIEDGKFVDCNRAAEKMILGTKQDLIGISPVEISPEFQPNGNKSLTAAKELIDIALSKGQTEFEWLHKRKDGSEFLAEIKLSKLNKNGEESLFTTWRDITEKRKTEIALLKSEERFRQISEHTGSVIWEVDHTGLFTFMGPVAKRVFGYAPEEIVGKKYFWDIFPENHRENLKLIGLKHLKEGIELFDWDNPIQRKDGKTIWVSSFGAAIRDDNGKIIGYRGADYDISARKIAEEELRKFRIISDQASYGTVITEFNTREITYCNEAFAKMHGYEIEELIGEEIFKLHTSEQLEFYLEKIYPEYEKNQEYSIKEFGRKRKDGSTFPGLVTAKLFYDEDGTPLFNAATVIDISEQKMIERQVKDQNLRFKAIVDAIPDLLFIMDKEGNYLEYYSSNLENYIGHFEYLVGKNLKEVFSEENLKIHLEKLEASFLENKIQTYEYVGINGFEKRHFECRIIPMTNDKALRFVREITERKKNESEIQKLTLAIEQSPVAIIITDQKGNLEYMSPAFLQMTGYSYEELNGQPIGMIKSGLTDRKIYEDLWETINSGKNWQHEWMNKRKSGELYWENILITPIQDETGRINNFLAVKQDITEQKKYEEEIISLNQNLEKRINDRTKELENINKELEIARNQADSANLAKSEFLSRMSHELRTPMNSILGFAQLLELTDLKPSQKKNLEYILKGGNHLLQLINEVLEISKIESGKISISLEQIELISTIEDVVESVRPFAINKTIKIAFENEFKSDCYVLADLQRLKQILINLLNNAIKYNKDNGNVYILLDKISAENGTKNIKISIQDDGIGISKKNISKLFRPFERAGNDNSSIEGTGLGLSVVEKLTKLMGGKVGVVSEEGIGSTFWVELPYLDAVKEKVSSRIPELEVNRDYHSKGKLLLIEDNISNIELIKELLRSLKPKSELISTMYGMECLPLAKLNDPSLILLDLNLPDIHGAKVLEMLKSNSETRNIPVIILSADATTKQIEEMLQKGADRYLTKPLNLVDMIGIFDLYLKDK